MTSNSTEKTLEVCPHVLFLKHLPISDDPMQSNQGLQHRVKVILHNSECKIKL